jgi:regulator of sigma E protease
LLTWIIVFVVFSVLILVHEAGHLFAAKKAGIRVEAFSLGMGRRLFGVKIGGTDYRVSLFPFGGYCKMAGEDPGESQGKDDEYQSKPVGHRFWVIVAGSLTNYIFAFILFSVIYTIGVPMLSNEVGDVMKGYPAETAGIKVGDTVLSLNGTKVLYWEDVVGAIQRESAKEGAIKFEIKRGDTIQFVDIKPQVSTVKNIFGQTISRPLIGIAPREKTLAVKYGPIEAVYHGGAKLLELTAVTYKGIWLLVTGGMPVKTSVAGPIGIARIMGQAADMGVVPLMIITAHVSMALAVFNLLPFPVLDGGHIIFLLIEKLRRRPVGVKTQEAVTQVALMLLIAFAVFVSWQDILKLHK